MRIGDWGYHSNQILDEEYTQACLREFAPNEPEEDWDDRDHMYCIYYNMLFSLNHLGEGRAVRQMASDDMYFLIDNYARFWEAGGPPRLAVEERVGLSAERDHAAA
ncbi:hypothetical protein VTL71DRAFT_11422 [Oculimacula yallundae]|uniref:Uncharacterized protein n=1 Tax=Oculimacula yallundae TaxID=86028 RepID=A0ABR4CSN0_9HELO